MSSVSPSIETKPNPLGCARNVPVIFFTSDLLNFPLLERSILPSAMSSSRICSNCGRCSFLTPRTIASSLIFIGTYILSHMKSYIIFFLCSYFLSDISFLPVNKQKKRLPTFIDSPSLYQIPMLSTIPMIKNKITPILVSFTNIPSIERPLFLPQ